MSWSSNLAVVERDPTGRYVRYNKRLGVGAWKSVYKGFDQVKGIEIAWSRIVITGDTATSESEGTLNDLCVEVCLLKSLDNENIVKCYHSWIDYQEKIIHMITEIFSSENLRNYTMNNAVVDYTAIKNWCRQILNGLNYLHTRNPPIMHCDVKLTNIFVNGNSGTVKLGDMGIAKFVKPETIEYDVAGTPAYMAPEIFEANYNQLVDIHSFGICVLQLVIPDIRVYSGCNNNEVVEKVKACVKPEELSYVTDPLLKNFIERCLAPADKRPAANELLNDPFLAPSKSTTRTNSSLTECRMRDQVDRLLQFVKEMESGNKKFKLQGRIKDNVMIQMKLSISNYGMIANFNLEFSPETVTAQQFVIEHIATHITLSSEDVQVATEIIKQLIAEFHGGPSIQNSISEEDFCLWNIFSENPTSVVYDDDDDDFNPRNLVPESSSSGAIPDNSRQLQANEIWTEEREDSILAHPVLYRREFEFEGTMIRAVHRTKEPKIPENKKMPSCFGNLLSSFGKKF
ncbi:probable serine/threonine-protein kinase WNK11 [Spinacia oleracea]|uniref:non-specific serine/threonine protein kinase n=1 Tax=Spinacia oleracea TaxID=3562 RepID=A0A9R0IJZ7_SPIOL|nr:probable serine/threonine-protein kinase WNK11 [Spinacia oleracea]